MFTKMVYRFAHGDVADITVHQRDLTHKYSAVFASIQAAVLFTLIHAYRDILLLHFPVRYAATYSARIEAVLARMEADEDGSNPEFSWDLLRHELSRCASILLTAGMVLLV